jgi:hypothetical protein
LKAVVADEGGDEDGKLLSTMDGSEEAQDRGQMGWYEDNAAE